MKTKNFRIMTANGQRTLYDNLSFDGVLNTLGISSTDNDADVARIAKLPKSHFIEVCGKCVARLK